MPEPDRETADSVDVYLQRLFANSGREIADDGFTARVMVRVARGQLLRLGVFALALLAAAAVVMTQLVPPLTELFAQFSQSVASLRIPAVTPTILAIVGAALAAVLTPIATLMLED